MGQEDAATKCKEPKRRSLTDAVVRAVGILAIVVSSCFVLLTVGIILENYSRAVENAIRRGDIRGLRRAIANGYSVNRLDRDERTLLSCAAWYGAGNIKVLKEPEVRQQKVYRMLKILLDGGADINARNLLDNRTALMSVILAYLSLHGNTPVSQKTTQTIAMLISRGVNVNIRSHSGETALHDAACLEDGVEICEMLIENGADVNAKGIFGNSPLHNAVSGDALQTAETLVRNGADVNARNDDGKTPLDLALQHEWKEVAELLRKHGGKPGDGLPERL